jgi:uncharacterized membrane protein YraQ (UPF0718 family)
MKKQSMFKSKSFRVALGLLVVLAVADLVLGNFSFNLEVFEEALSVKALHSASFQFISMLKIVPPIFLLIGLLDVWVPRETMIKLMGDKSGVRGIAIAFFLGTMTAGPLVAAFPVATIMLKKGARYANVLFFLMIWASAKLPIVFFQATTLGLKYTVVTNITLIVVYLFGTAAIERILTKDERREIVRVAEQA